MDLSWHGLMSFSETPFILFLILLVASHFIYRRYFRYIPPVTASGSVLMALGIIGMECLPQFNVPNFVMMIIALELVVIWFYLAIRFSQAYLDDQLVFNSFTDCRGVGTWIAGTVFTVLLLDDVESTLHGFIVLLGLVAVILWVVYLVILFRWLSFSWRTTLQIFAGAMLMFAAVSTQSIVLLFSALFHNDIPVIFYQVMISLAILFYLLGLAGFISHVAEHPKHKLATWFQSDNIHYGVMSITGLAMLNTSVFPDEFVMVVWWWAALSFFLIVCVDIGKLLFRIRSKGGLKAIFVYDLSQWARVFDYGIFYAFTFAYYHQEHPDSLLVEMVANYGQYIVLGLLLFELIAWVGHAVKLKRLGEAGE